MRIVLFFLVETVAALLIGLHLVSELRPVWSAEALDVKALDITARRHRDQAERGPPGSLLLKTDDGYTDAARLGVDVDLTVSDRPSAPASRRSSEIRTQDWMEATYVYPLPPGGAVDTLKMVVGDRVIVGDIKERQQARAVYEEARRPGARRPDRAGAAEHLHQFRRQYRPAKRAGADRISGAVQQNGNESRAGADGGGSAL